MEIDENCRWIYCAPFHKNIKENITDSIYRTYSFLHLKSRSKLCTNPDAKMLFNLNYDIRGLCDKCPDKHVCAYERNLKEAYKDRPNLAITHGHLQNWLPKFLNREIDGEVVGDDYDVLIIDENPIKTFMCIEDVWRNEIRDIWNIARDADCDDDLIDLLDLLQEPVLDYDEIEKIKLDSKRLARNIIRFGKKAHELWTIGAIRNIPKNIINQLYKVSSYFGIKNIEKMIRVVGRKIKLSYFNPEIISQLNIKKIIALDGTATKHVWEKMLGASPDMMIAGVKYEHAYQLKDYRYVSTSWVAWKKASGPNPTPGKLCKIIDKIAERKERNTLVVCTKRVKEEVMKRCKIKRDVKHKELGWNKIDFANYYALRGLNDYYKRCDTVILAHEPNPPESEIIMFSELSGWSKDVWRTVYREEEMRQAIGRIRENMSEYADGKERGVIEVFIFPNTGVDKFDSKLLPDAQVIGMVELKRILSKPATHIKIKSIQEIIYENMPTNITRLMGITGFSRTRVQKHLNNLMRRGFVKQIGRSEYDITKKKKELDGRSKFWIEKK